MSDMTREELIALAKERAVDGRITCPVARKMADEAGVEYRVIGEVADEAELKIVSCALGCF